METNEFFSFQRIQKLAQYQYAIERKTILLQAGGFFVMILLALVLGQTLGDNHLGWNNQKYMGTFTLFYFIGGIVYAANSFKWLRSKEARYAYLMIPATSMEKFVFEFISRIIGFMIIVPCVYWILANAEGYIYHLFNPDFLNYQFSFIEGFSKMDVMNNNEVWELLLACCAGMLFVTIPFMGATYFKKNPFAKLLLSMAAINVAFIIYGVILFKIFGIEHVVHLRNTVIFSTGNSRELVFGILLLIINIVSLAIGYYNIKEKEV